MKTERSLPADGGLAEEHDAPSKSQKKRESTALQKLGQDLLELPAQRLAAVAMPDRLREAIAEAQRITKHEAKRRQLQYIGRLMRDVDPAPLREAVAAARGLSAAANARQHRLERLRERLMADEAVFAELAREHPAADMQHLRQLRRNALREADQGKPPRAYRELFRELRALLEDDREAGAGEAAPPFHR